MATFRYKKQDFLENGNSFVKKTFSSSKMPLYCDEVYPTVYKIVSENEIGVSRDAMLLPTEYQIVTKPLMCNRKYANNCAIWNLRDLVNFCKMKKIHNWVAFFPFE